MQIEEIKPTILPELAIRRVAAYARVSTGSEEALHSVSAQISYYNEYISTHPGWEFAGVYADAGISGTKANRPEFQRLLADCRAGKIDLVITKSITRFARNTVTLLDTVRELKLLGIDVYFEKENLHSTSGAGELMLTLLAMYAEEEARSASENQKWRIQKMFATGRPNTGRMLGYRLRDGRLEIIPEEAELVREIFQLYLSGLGITKIANLLNARKIPSLYSKEWSPNTIQALLRNEKYAGNLLLQKTYVEDFRTKRKKVNKGERRQYFVEDSHEAIIDKAIFRQVQAEIQRRQEQRRPTGKPAAKYAFTGLIVCGRCGQHYRRKITAAGTRYAKPVWICATFNMKGKARCASQQIPEAILLEKTREVVKAAFPETEWPELTPEDFGILQETIAQILVPAHHQLVFVLTDGREIPVSWQNPSRSLSWTPEMREKARQRRLEQIRQKKGEQT
ncbi:MAG: recombinase family protein [Acutalibacteraceae bacterium]